VPAVGVRENKKHDFIFRPPKEMSRLLQKPQGGGEWDAEEHKELVDEIGQRGLDEKFRTTTSAIRIKEIKDPSLIYLVAEIDNSVSEGKRNVLIQKLSATVHDYMNEEHSTLLISVPATYVKLHEQRSLPLPAKEPLLDLRQLKFEEQISKALLQDSKWTDSIREVIVHTMPNVDVNTSEKYVSQLLEYLKNLGSGVSRSLSPKQGMLIAKLQKVSAEELLKKTNIVYKIEPLPIGIATNIIGKAPKLVGKRASLSQYTTSQPVDGLPIVCIADTGLNDIPQISSCIHTRTKEASFSDSDDSDPEGHGTPIACLVALGEGGFHCRARIISHKIYSDQIPDCAFDGMLNAIDLYSFISRIFASSIDFDVESSDALYAYSKLDQLIQQKNICFVSSAGNIPPANINSGRYPHNLKDFPVLHPAQNTHVIGVGAITRKDKNGAIAPKNCLSPFTRYGKTLSKLYDAKKPDTVEHGGNICYDGDSSGIGVSSFFKTGIASDAFIGTSYSAPLVAGHLAEILGKYAGCIKNSETLKSILFMSCNQRENTGFGNGAPNQFLFAEENQAVFVFEGSVKLPDSSPKRQRQEYFDRVSVPVPAGTKRIDMCIVHSDNYTLSEPTLDTYVQIHARKSGSASIVPPLNKDEENKREYVKYFRWSFKRKSMEGAWDFDIFPKTTEFIDEENKKSIILRYGCVILLTAQSRRFRPLTEDVIAEMNRWK
jgi:hypothetical protein